MLGLSSIESTRPILLDSCFELSKTIAMPGFHSLFSLTSPSLINHLRQWTQYRWHPPTLPKPAAHKGVLSRFPFRTAVECNSCMNYCNDRLGLGSAMTEMGWQCQLDPTEASRSWPGHHQCQLDVALRSFTLCTVECPVIDLAASRTVISEWLRPAFCKPTILLTLRILTCGDFRLVAAGQLWRASHR